MPRTAATLPVANIEFTQSEGSPVDFLFGKTSIARRDFHVVAVRVVNRREGSSGFSMQGLPANASEEAEHYYEAIGEMNEGYLETIKIPGQPGDWVLAVFPFAD